MSDRVCQLLRLRKRAIQNREKMDNTIEESLTLAFRIETYLPPLIGDNSSKLNKSVWVSPKVCHDPNNLDLAVTQQVL